jgi:hypothetical protein
MVGQVTPRTALPEVGVKLKEWNARRRLKVLLFIENI